MLEMHICIYFYIYIEHICHENEFKNIGVMTADDNSMGQRVTSWLFDFKQDL